MILQTM